MCSIVVPQVVCVKVWYQYYAMLRFGLPTASALLWFALWQRRLLTSESKPLGWDKLRDGAGRSWLS